MPVTFTVSPVGDIRFTVGAVIIRHQSYPGPYTVTPADTAQTLPTRDLVMTQNLTVEPIPSNYGRITYNGYELTVS